MSVKLITVRQGRNSIQEALHNVTYFPHRIHNYEEYVQETNHFYDAVSGYMHLADTFELSETVHRVGEDEVYTVNGRHKVLLSDVSNHFLARILFAPTQLHVNVIALFASIRLSGLTLHRQVMCCAAGVKEYIEPTKFGYANKSGNRFSWFRLLLDMGFTILSDDNSGPIRDSQRNSILDIVADWNVKDLLRAILRTRIQAIFVSDETRDRFRALALKDTKVRECLSRLNVCVNPICGYRPKKIE